MKPEKEINAYIKSYPKEVQPILLEMYGIITTTASDTEESMGYGMPKFSLNGCPLYFGAFKNHIGLYPGPKVIKEFQDELADWKNSKGAIQFPYAKPLPKTLIKKIVRHCLRRGI